MNPPNEFDEGNVENSYLPSTQGHHLANSIDFSMELASHHYNKSPRTDNDSGNAYYTSPRQAPVPPRTPTSHDASSEAPHYMQQNLSSDRMPPCRERNPWPSVQRTVELFNASQSPETKTSHHPQSSILDLSRSKETPHTDLWAGRHSRNRTSHLSPAADFQGYGETPPHAHTPRRTMDQRTYSNIPQEYGQPLAEDLRTHLPASISNPEVPTALSGYHTKSSTGQMALVCPLSDDMYLQYLMRGFDSISPATVQIISLSQPSPPMMTQRTYPDNSGELPTIPAIPSLTLSPAPPWDTFQAQMHPATRYPEVHFREA